MIKLIIKTLIIILLTTNNNNNEIKTNKNVQNTEIIGNIIIDKINLNKPLYNINNNKNNIEENIEVLKESILPPNNNSIIFLAAHSGTSNISYFNEILCDIIQIYHMANMMSTILT